jgi:hypothetical protein
VSDSPRDRWPALWNAFGAFYEDMPEHLTSREAFDLELRLHNDPPGITAALEEYDEFAAGGDDEARCEWLLGDFEPSYDPEFDFGSNQACVFWVRDRLRAAVS